MKPQLVLHICCAPDEAWVVHSLRDQYDLHCFFCNPNISPLNEYNLRLEQAKNVAQYYNVRFSSDEYNPQSWEQAIAEVSDTPERGERCRRCFHLRLTRTALFCKENGYKTFTTVMSVSPHKNITMLNETGQSIALAQEILYMAFDFKKNNGFRNSITLSKELGLYRQDYCGCRLSKRERDERIKRRSEHRIT
jgi:predicted adenine nucleotide alpha hydrolase (AANH) superfamily ATPase